MSLVIPPLYAIMDASLLATSELAFAEMLARTGVELIQYRNKQASARALFTACRNLCERLQSTRTRLIVNDRPDVVALCGAGGVHVGQGDASPEVARRTCGAAAWIGVSTHTLEQVCEADRAPVDYIAFGPIFPTSTKSHPDPVVGTDLLRQARFLTGKPLVAIGGITRERAEELYRAGADSLAVARDLFAAADPVECVQGYLRIAAGLRRN